MGSRLDEIDRFPSFSQRFWIAPVRRVAWVLHDHLLKYILGNGANNSDLPALPPIPIVPKAVHRHDEFTDRDVDVVLAVEMEGDPHANGNRNGN